MSTNMWQHPFVNILKHYNISTWKKITKGGEVTSRTDKQLKCTVHDIKGSVPASNFVQLPALATQSLCLTGRYFYLLFRPHPSRHFVFHIDVASSEGLNVRISFSNIYREFKSSSTWIQFPFICKGGHGTIHGITELGLTNPGSGPASLSSRWTVLCLDLTQILTTYLNRRYTHVRGIQLCANMSIKTALTSDQEYCPGVTLVEARNSGMLPLPREVSFFVHRGERWEDHYDFIRFPSNPLYQTNPPYDSVHARTSVKSLLSTGDKKKQKGQAEVKSDGDQIVDAKHVKEVNEGFTKMSIIPEIVNSKEVNLERPLSNKVSHIQSLTSPRDGGSGLATAPLRLPSASLPTADDLPLVNIQREAVGRIPIIDISAQPEVKKERPKEEIHVFAQPRELPTTDIEEHDEISHGKKSLRPEPVMTLSHAIGVTPCWNDLLYSERSEADGGSEVVYACHAIVVAMEVKTGRQRFFVGHSNRVTCIAMDASNHLLASGSGSLIRIWSFATCSCLAVAKAPVQTVRLLSMSSSGEILVAVGRDEQQRHVMAVWRIAEERGGESARLTMLARASVEADIRRIRVLPPTLPSSTPTPATSNIGHRIISAGRNNIRLWRVKEGHLRSSPIDLGEYAGAQLQFTDCAFDNTRQYFDDKMIVYVCALSGHIFCIDVGHFRVDSVKRLLPTEEAITSGRLPHPHDPARHHAQFDGGIGLSAIAVGPGDAFVATGSQDGFLRLWPSNFGHVYLEAQHDSAVTSVLVSPDARKLMVATESASIGTLDLSSRAYTTLMRSHTGLIAAAAIDPVRRHIATVSPGDGSVRVWHADTRQQLYDFASRDGAVPTSLAYHPKKHALACGFSSGILRLFDVSKSTLEAEQRVHRSSINDLVFSPTGHRLYTCDALGTLCLLDVTKPPFHVRRLLDRTVMKTDEANPGILAIDREGMKLAYIGPTSSTIILADAHSLDDIVRIDISLIERQVAMDEMPPPSHSALDANVSGAARLVFSPNGRHLVLTTNNGVIIRLSSNDGQLLAARKEEKQPKLTKPKTSHTSAALAISPYDGRYIINSIGSHGLLRIGDASLRAEIRTQRFIGHGQTVSRLVFAPDGSSLVSVSDSILVWKFHGGPGSMPIEPADVDMAPASVPKELFDAEEKEKVEVGDVVSMPESLYDDRTTIRESRLTMPVVRVDPSLPNGSNDHIDDQDPPTAFSHFKPREHIAEMAHRRYIAPPAHCGLQLNAVIGYTGTPSGQTLKWDSPTGFFAYVCGRAVIVEDLENGSQRHLMAGETQAITTIALSNDRRYLVCAGSGQMGVRPAQLCVWDIGRLSEIDNVEGALLQCRDCHPKGSAIQAMAFSTDDHFLVTVGTYNDGSLVVWETSDPTCWEVVARMGLPSVQHTIAWDPLRQNVFVTAGSAGTLHWWRVDRLNELHPLSLLTSIESPTEMTDGSRSAFEITCIAFLPALKPLSRSSSPNQPNSSILVVGSNTGRVALWQDGDCVLHWEADRSEVTFILPVCGSDNEDDTPRLVTGSVTGSLRLWNLGRLIERLCGVRSDIIEHHSNIVPTVIMTHENKFSSKLCSASVDPQGDLCVVGTSDGGIWLVDWTSSAPPTQLAVPLGGGKLPSIDWSPGPSPGWLAVVCDADGSVSVLDVLKSREQVCRIAVAGGARASVVTFAPTGCRLAVGYVDGNVRHFDVQRVELLDRWTPLSSPISALRFSNDEKVLICGGTDGLVSVIALASSLGVIRQITDHRGARITSIDITNDKWLAASIDRRISVWRADWSCDVCEMIDWLTFPGSTTDQLLDPPPPVLARFASPHEPDLLLYSGNGVEPRIQVYSLSKRRVLRTINLYGHCVDSIDLSRKDPLIVVGSRQWLTKLIDMYEGSFQDYVQQGDGVMTLKFTPDGNYLATAAFGELLIWKVREPSE